MTETTPSAQKVPTKEYELKAPKGHPEGEPLLIKGGVELFDGDKVDLWPDQATRHKNILAA